MFERPLPANARNLITLAAQMLPALPLTSFSDLLISYVKSLLPTVIFYSVA